MANGVSRNIQADIAKKGISGEDALKIAMGPAATRAEKGTCEEEWDEDEDQTT